MTFYCAHLESTQIATLTRHWMIIVYVIADYLRIDFSALSRIMRKLVDSLTEQNLRSVACDITSSTRESFSNRTVTVLRSQLIALIAWILFLILLDSTA